VAADAKIAWLLLLLLPRGGGRHEPGGEGVAAVQRGAEVEVARVAQRVVLTAPRRRRPRAQQPALPTQPPHQPAQRQPAPPTPGAPPCRRSGGVALCCHLDRNRGGRVSEWSWRLVVGGSGRFIEGRAVGWWCDCETGNG
jgi:hypothetical protein